MLKPKVSVVIPAYNAMKYLPDTLKSVWCQTFTDFEVIVVDDGSSDNIKEWASQIKDSRFRIISQNNQGLPSARNTGINNSQGEYIAFLDSDDLWAPTKLETHVACLDNNSKVGAVCSWTAMMNAQGQPTGRLLKVYADGNVYSKILVKNIIGCPSVVVRQACFDKVGLFNTNIRYVEDWEMWIRIAAAYEFAVIKKPLVYYRQHSNNMSKNWQQMQLGFNKVISIAFESAPRELQHLNNSSYGNANLVLAWKALQSQDKDFQLAANFRATALRYNPKLILSHEFWRLSLAIILMRYFGFEGYNRFLQLANTIRTRISNSLPPLSPQTYRP